MQDLEFLFSPKSIAIVGASSNPDTPANRNFLRPLLALGYQGRIYPVNPNHAEVLGLKAYANVRDIPETVDYVVCALPAHLTPQLVRDCVAAKARAVSIFTAGFSETGEAEGARLEREIANIARQGGIRMVGPNCLGVHCPGAGVYLEADIPKESGHVSFLSQSGGNAKELILSGVQREIYLNKLVSYGNAADLNEADFLEYFAHDNDTRIISAYIEGIKDPPRFHRTLREAAAAKPVIVLKGGITEAGTGAAESHTGALAGSKEIWDSLCRQTGAIQVGDMEEMQDTILVFSLLKPPRGRRVGMVGIGGGASGQAADDCESAGLILPAFPQEVRQELRTFIPAAGTGIRNPIDAAADVYWEPAAFARTAEIVAGWEGVDIIFVMLNATATLRRGVETLKAQLEGVMRVGKTTDKPLAIILRTGSIIKAENMAREVERDCLKAGFPVYRSCYRTARAINHLVSYHEMRRQRSRGRP